jgi:hypothetical protein
MVSQSEGAPPENIRLPWKNLAVTNTLAYSQSVGEKKVFITSGREREILYKFMKFMKKKNNKIIYHLGLFIHL